MSRANQGLSSQGGGGGEVRDPGNEVVKIGLQKSLDIFGKTDSSQQTQALTGKNLTPIIPKKLAIILSHH